MSRSLRCFLILLFVLVIFSSTGFAQISYQVFFSERDLIFEQKDGFDVVSLKGGIRSQDVGCPDLPLKLIHLILPNDSEVADVSITNAQHILLDGDFLIFPGQPDEKTDYAYEKEWVKPDTQVYNSDSLYPPQLVEIVEEGYLAGSHLVTLALYPLQYQPKSRRLVFYTQLDIRVELEHSEKISSSSQIQRRSTRAQKLYEKILHQLVDNKTDIPNLICKDFQPALSKVSIDSSAYPPYLVITSSELKSAFLPLVEWKTRKGTGATIVCIDSILLGYPGRDDAEKLKNFLTFAYQNGTSWVLLGGDEEVVPIRYAYPTNTSTPPSISIQHICDLYFSDVDGEWDLDNDGIWGEPQDDSPDIYPDLFVGRVPTGDTVEAKAFVEKLLSYEKNPGNGTTDYLTRALWMSSDQMRDYGQHNLVSEYIPSCFYQDLTTLIESPTGNAENPVSPDGGTCVEVMNQGWGIIGVLAHGKSSGFVAKSNLTNGTPKSWVYTFPGENDGHGHMPDLDSEHKYGIMYSISCSQSAIDVEGGTPCVGEFYSLVHQKGGVAFLGYSRWGWVSVSYKLFEKFLEYLFDSDLGHHIGVAEALSRCAYPSYRDINYGHNLFGDPEMPVWADIPSDLAVVHPDEVSMGWRTINFSVTSQGAGVGDALVCLTLRDRIMFLGETDPNGNLSCEINLDDVGEMSVVVTKPNFIPYEDSITVSLSADVGEDEANSGIQSFELFQNFPNPFNPVTSIQYAVCSRQIVSRQTKTADGGRWTADSSLTHTTQGKAVDGSQFRVHGPIHTTQGKAVDGSQFTVHGPIHTTLKIYNILGQKVRTLVDEPKKSGNYRVIWDGKDDKGKDVSSGIYFYTLEMENYKKTKKMTRMK